MTGGGTGRTLTTAQVEQRRAAATSHGARSDRQVAPLARNLKRRVLRQLNLRAGELDPLAAGYLELYVRALTKVRLYDEWLDEHGLVNSDGESPGFMATYFASLNSARLALTKLEGHLDARVDPTALDVLIGEGRRIREARENGDVGD